MIVDEGKAQINYHLRKSSNLIGLVESEIKYKILQKNIEKRELEAIKKMRQENDCFAIRYPSRNR